MTKEFSLDLRLFDGDAGDGPGTADSVSMADNAVDTAGGQIADGQGEGEQEQPEVVDLDKEFDDLIKGKYQEQYKARQQKAINQRFKGLEAERQEAAKADKLKDALSIRYGLKGASTDDLITAINNDQSFLEEAAAREGLTTEQFRKMSDLEMRAQAAERQADAAKRQQMEADYNQQLQSQAEECKAQFPDFDFESEVNNPTFRNMVLQGADITSAYKFAHMDELLASGMAKAASKGAEATAKAVKANLQRASEAGARNVAAATISTDFSKMSSDEFNAYQNKLMSGEL